MFVMGITFATASADGPGIEKKIVKMEISSDVDCSVDVVLNTVESMSNAPNDKSTASVNEKTVKLHFEHWFGTLGKNYRRIHFSPPLCYTYKYNKAYLNFYKRPNLNSDSIIFLTC
jgi:hypothetical protein